MVTAILSQSETASELENFWRNFYLRGTMFYDPTGVIGGTFYDQPYSGLPFSRGWIITPDQMVDQALFGHHPERVIGRIHQLLEDLDCNGADSSNCLHLEAGPGGPRLTISRGTCEPAGASGPFDVIRGRLGHVGLVDGVVDLGSVECVASDLAEDRVLDVSPDPAATCTLVPAVFYLAKSSLDDDFGTASGGQPRSMTDPALPCP